MPFDEDLTEFFDTLDGFATTATLNGSAVDGIVSVVPDPADSVEGVERRFWCDASFVAALPADRTGHDLTIGSVSYRAHVLNVSNGIARLGLHYKRGQIVLGLMGHVADWQADANLEALLSRSDVGLHIDGNAFKWNFVWAGPGLHDYDFSAADASWALAAANGQTYRLHSLLRGTTSFYPAPYSTLTRASRLASNKTHIEALLGRFAGSRCEVWNELLTSAGALRQFPDVGGDTPEEMTEWEAWQAFVYAAAADPSAKLGIADFGCETAGAKQDGFHGFCERALAAGIPLHFVSFQGHIRGESYPTCEEWRATFRRFRELGLEVDVSELDVRVAGVVGDEAAKQAAQAAALHELAIAARLEGVSFICWWGAFDGRSWIYSEDGTSYPDEQPLPFADVTYAEKPMWTALKQNI